MIDNLLVRIHFIIVMIRWTGLAPWEFECAFPGSLISTFLNQVIAELVKARVKAHAELSRDGLDSAKENLTTC